MRVSKKTRLNPDGTEIPNSTTEDYMLDESYRDRGENHDQVNSLYQFRFCKKCEEIKPPRSHHCSACNRCVMKMDHHCPWVGNCVALFTHKTFWLFNFYATLALYQVCLTTFFYTEDLQK